MFTQRIAAVAIKSLILLKQRLCRGWGDHPPHTPYAVRSL